MRGIGDVVFCEPGCEFLYQFSKSSSPSQVLVPVILPYLMPCDDERSVSEDAEKFTGEGRQIGDVLAVYHIGIHFEEGGDKGDREEKGWEDFPPSGRGV